MRKSRSKRKTERPQSSSSSGQVSTPGTERTDSMANSSTMNGDPQGSSAGRRRNVTPEEAALTAKNYRLAKELSELRVRHRDETKTVTRLTMENMNLASRCRQAIHHVEALKKELSMYQQKSTEIVGPLDTQGNNQYRDVIQPEEESTGDLFHQASALSKSGQHVPLTNGLEDIRPATRSDYVDKSINSSPSTKPQSAVNSSRNVEESNQDPGDIPMTSIGPISGGNTKASNDSADLTFGELNSTDFFQDMYESSLPATPERGNMDALDERMSTETSMSDEFKAFDEKSTEVSGVISKGEDTSFDAFEASFQTTFPSSFSASENSTSNVFTMNDFEDPFFVDSSPADNQGIEFRNTMDPLMNNALDGNEIENGDSSGDNPNLRGNNGRGKSPPPPQFGIRSRSRSRSRSRITDESSRKNSNLNRSTHSDFSPNPPTQTPSHESNSDIKEGGMKPVQPFLESEPLTEIHPPQDREHSPTLLLRRIQQRRAREKPAVSENKNNDDGMSLSEEIRKLDAMAGGSSPGEIPLTAKTAQNKRRASKGQQASPTRRGNLHYSKKENVEILANSKGAHHPNNKTSHSSPLNQSKGGSRNTKNRLITDSLERRHDLVPTVPS